MECGTEAGTAVFYCEVLECANVYGVQIPIKGCRKRLFTVVESHFVDGA